MTIFNIENSNSRSSSPVVKVYEVKVSNLTSNIQVDHLSEIFGYIGKVTKVEMADSKSDPKKKVSLGSNKSPFGRGINYYRILKKSRLMCSSRTERMYRLLLGSCTLDRLTAILSKSPTQRELRSSSKRPIASKQRKRKKESLERTIRRIEERRRQERRRFREKDRKRSPRDRRRPRYKQKSNRRRRSSDSDSSSRRSNSSSSSDSKRSSSSSSGVSSRS